MKGVFISFYQAFYEELVAVLDKLEIRGFTFWEEVQGRGSETGEPHYGTHAWPTLNSAMMIFMEEEKIPALKAEVDRLDKSAPLQGIRMFTWNVD